MVCIVFADDNIEKRDKLMHHLAAKFPSVTSWMYMINSKLNDSTGDLEAHLWQGREYIIEALGSLKFRIGAKSFFQTNTRQAERLYDVVKEFANLSGSEVVYDLYTGAGTIACYVAERAKKVVGVEYVEEAIVDARLNAADNGIDNCTFFAGDMRNVMTDDFIAINGKPDVIVLDPPRAGVHEDVLQAILRATPERIVYVSCNPATQARDLAILAEKYKIVEVQPVDMFPHTHHVENVVKLEIIT
jgi:23S rRNA (uracil1939-C5)-methyltransferase